MWTYLLVYEPTDFAHADVESFLAQHQHIFQGYQVLPNSYFFASDWSADGLTLSFVRRLGAGRFFIVDTNTDRNGRLPKKVWKLINDPEQG